MNNWFQYVFHIPFRIHIFSWFHCSKSAMFDRGHDQGCALDLLAPSTLLLSWQLVIYEMQIWRLSSCPGQSKGKD